MKSQTSVLYKAAIFICAIAFIQLFFTACTENKAASRETEKYQVTNPAVLDTSVSSEYVADIHSLKNVELRARVKGYLDKIFVDEGQTVKQGEVLFSISKQEYSEELIKAKANLKSALADVKAAEVDVQNVQTLVDKKVVSKTELEMSQSKLEAANAKVEEAKTDISSAELNLSYTDIKAPFDGIIGLIPNKTGSLINEGTLLSTISDNKEVFAYFNVPEQEYLNFSKQDNENKTVQLVLANNETYPVKGKVETVESEIDKGTGNITFRARFENPDFILKNGSAGKVILKKEIKNAILIPQKCAFEVQDKNYVYVVDQNNTVQLRNITPQYRLPNYYIVESGLSANDRIIYEGIQMVKEGDKISAETISFTQVTKQLAQL
jgi:RND family efflux transporter MFP subunit